MAYEIEHIATHEERVWLREKIESRRLPPADGGRRAARAAAAAHRGRGARALPPQGLPRARSGSRSRAWTCWCRCSTSPSSGRPRRGARDVVIGMAHRGPAQRAGPHRGPPVRDDLRRVRGRPAGGRRAAHARGRHRRREVPPRRRGRVRRPRAGKAITVTLSPNPSHLEFVGPVVDGRARAQADPAPGPARRTTIPPPRCRSPSTATRRSRARASWPRRSTSARSRAIAPAARSTSSPTTRSASPPTWRTRAPPATRPTWPRASTSRSSTSTPTTPRPASRAVRLAMAYRERFHQDVLIDLVGYRRHGHNEGDEPAYTQPLMYERIKALPDRARAATRARWSRRGRADRGGGGRARRAQAYQRLVDIQQAFKASIGQHRHQGARGPPERRGPGGRDRARAGVHSPRSTSSCSPGPRASRSTRSCSKQLERRRAALGPEGGIDWAHAEALAFASLLTEGVPIRLTGQDTERGTFSQRHLVLHDAKTGRTLGADPEAARRAGAVRAAQQPALRAGDPRLRVRLQRRRARRRWCSGRRSSATSSTARRSSSTSSSSAGLSKWGLTTRLMLLLPHGYEGQGPEHSSARLERFLQLAAEGNIRVANCTTPAQYFHLLRRQARRTRQRPLVVMTPKSLLRLPQAQLAPGGPGRRAVAAGARRSRRPRSGAGAADGWSSAAARSTTTCWPRRRRWATRARRSSGWSSSTPSPGRDARRCSPRYPAAGASWSGSRKSRGTWAPGPTSSRSCGSSRRRAWRCATSAGPSGRVRPRDIRRRTRPSRAGSCGRRSRGDRRGAEPLPTVAAGHAKG